MCRWILSRITSKSGLRLKSALCFGLILANPNKSGGLLYQIQSEQECFRGTSASKSYSDGSGCAGNRAFVTALRRGGGSDGPPRRSSLRTGCVYPARPFDKSRRTALSSAIWKGIVAHGDGRRPDPDGGCAGYRCHRISAESASANSVFNPGRGSRSDGAKSSTKIASAVS